MGTAIGPTAYTFKVQDTSNIIRSMRKSAPAHYLFEIEAFTTIKKVMLIYPNGNKNDDGDDHISLYLKLIDELDHACFVHATFKFFIYDCKRHTYLTIQGAGEYIYDAIDKTKGIPKALPLNDFVSPSNGFLKNDRCIFGIEVFVTDTIARNARLSNIMTDINSIYTWPIRDFSELRSGEYSNPFFLEGRQWRLLIFPRGWGQRQDAMLALYLVIMDASDLTNGKRLYVEQQLRVKNLLTGEDLTRILCSWYSKSDLSWGTHELLSLSDLHNSQKGFKIDDKVIVQVKLNLMMLVNDI